MTPNRLGFPYRGDEADRTSQVRRSKKFATRKQRQATAKLGRWGDVPERTICYRASQQRSEARNHAPANVGTGVGVGSQWCNRLPEVVSRPHREMGRRCPRAISSTA
jgi:hypothetical protein